MPEPFGLSLAALVQLGKKDGPKVAAAAYRKLAHKGWASNLSKTALKGQSRPRPRLALQRALRKDGLDVLLTAAVVNQDVEPSAGLIDAVNRGLRRDPRWRRLAEDVCRTRSRTYAGLLIEYFIESLDPSRAASVVHDSMTARLDVVDQRLEEQLSKDSALLAGHEKGQTALMRERLAALPAAARPWLEGCFTRDDDGVRQVIALASVEGVTPGEAAAEWIRNAPAWLGARDAPIRPECWSALGVLALVYAELESASAAFESAVRAGALPGDRFLGYAAWAAIQAGDVARARAVLPPDGEQDSLDPVMALVALRCRLLSGDSGSGDGANPGGEDSSTQLTSEVVDRARTVLRRWEPRDPLDRDLRARLGAEFECADSRLDDKARFGAASALLGACLEDGWVDTVALALSMVLIQRAYLGAMSDRAGDLERAEQLAVRAREDRRQVGQDSRRATDLAVTAAGLGQRFRRLIELGSHQFGGARPDEASFPSVIRGVAQAAALDVPEVASQLEETIDEVPAGFTRACVRAVLLCRAHRVPPLPADEQILVWQNAVQEAADEEELRLALNGLAGVGGSALSTDQLAQLVPSEAAEVRARSALMNGDAPTAVRLLLPYQDQTALIALTLAEAYAAMGKSGVAIEILVEATERFGYGELTIEAARIAVAAKEPERAEQLLRDVLASAVSSWTGRALALRFLGELQADRGDWSGAMACWTASLQRDPFDVTVRWHLAKRYAVRGDDGHAWEVLTDDPHHPGQYRDPPQPPNAGYAHLVLTLLRVRGDRVRLVGYALDYAEAFADEPRFLGSALALAWTPGTGQLNSVQLDAAQQTRLNQAVADFHSTHPDDPAFRAIAIDPEMKPEELVAKLAEHSRPDPQLVENIKLLEANVVRGVTPFGVIPTQLGRSYAQAIVEVAPWLLVAEGDETEHASSIDTAMNALGITLPAAGGGLFSAAATPAVSVVIDLTALYACSALRALQMPLHEGFRQIVMADNAFTDLLQAHENFLTDQWGVAMTDPETGRFTIQAIDPSARQTQRAIIAEMRGLATGLRREIVRETTGSRLDQLPDQHRASAWCATLRLAHDRNAIVWADDIALRNLAREMGVPAFSTLALLEAQVQLNQLIPEMYEAAQHVLAKSSIGDLALNPIQLTALLDDGREGRLAAVAMLAKPPFWRNLPLAFEKYCLMARKLKRVDPEFLPGVAGNAITGIARLGHRPDFTTDFSAKVLAMCVALDGRASAIPNVLAAARSAARLSPVSLPDLLPTAAAEVLRGYRKRYPENQLAEAALTQLFAHCTVEDQAIVRRVILTI